MEVYDAVIVGAGHNGLVAGALLAKRGLRVLAIERREILGGCCVTEEIAPGCRASTTSYIASMLRPEVIRELELVRHGLVMTPCSPALQIAVGPGAVLAQWEEMARTVEELRRFSPRDARQFERLDGELRQIAARLQPLFLELPPETRGGRLSGALSALAVARPFLGVSGHEIEGLTRVLTGSLGELADARFETSIAKQLLLANNLYGKHGGPYQPGSLLGLVFHLLSGGEQEVQGFFGHVMGGMGAISEAIASAGRSHGLAVRTGTGVAAIMVRENRARGVVLDGGEEILARIVLSGADPKHTFLSLVDEKCLPEEFLADIRGIKMAGPCAKVNFVLDAEPAVIGMPADADPARRALFTLVPELGIADACYDRAKRGGLPDADELFVDCVVASNVDPSLAPQGRHIMTCFVQYVPYRLAAGSWEDHRELLGDRVLERITVFAPKLAESVVARQVLTPLDLERIYGLTEGNIFHGDLAIDQLFHMRPVPGWARYATPIKNLYLCGAGTHPGGGVTGAPGYNAARRVLADLRRRRR